MKFTYKYLFFALLVLITASVALAQDDQQAKFKKGVEYYSASDYEAALREWTDIYNTGYRSATLEYNIGNAYFKLNNTPGAILFYERAHLLKPADGNINYNLQIARSLVVDKFEEIPELFFVRWFDFLSLLAPTNRWAWISIVTFVTFLLLFSAYIYSSKYRIKVVSFWVAIFLFVISASSFSFALRNKTLVYDSKRAVVFAPIVNGKSSPDSSGTDLFVLHEGSTVAVEDIVGDWYEIILSDGNKGWVPSASLTII